MRPSLTRVFTIALSVALTGAVLVARPAGADVGDIGYEGPSYAGTGASTHPTESKPESKLWWNDGIWWADMMDIVSADYHIFRLDVATQTWSDTGVPLDPRADSRADTLWDGTHLYVASHHFSTSPALADPSRLYRYSYNRSTKTYSLDPGFPVVINNYKTETLVIAKDSLGKLWATWVQDTQVYVNRTTTDDLTWGVPFVLPVAGTSVNIDDISSVVAMYDGSIGVMWSNQNAAAMYFAVHTDGAPDTSWQASRTALVGKGSADDHVNLKSVQADRTGRVYAVTKTSFTTKNAPLIMLLVRDPATGDWASYVVGRVSDSHTRPIVLLNEEDRTIHVFATGPQPPSTSGQSGGEIYEKTTSMDAISFPLGYGTPVIRDANVGDQNDVTSTKQNVTSTTGIVVLATNGTTLRYWHAYESLASPPAPPVASFTAAPTTGTAPLTVQFTDTSTGGTPASWAWSFGDGATSVLPSPSHTYSAGGSFDVSLTVTNGSGSNTSTVPAMIHTTLPPPPTASFTSTPASGTAPLSVQFTDTSTGSPTGWSWNFGDGTTSTVHNPSHVYETAGTFDVTLTASNAGGSNTVTHTAAVSVAPGSTTTITFTPVADARVSEASPTSNYGTATTLRVVSATSASWHTYVKFSVTGVSGPVGAKLRFHVTDGSPDGGTVFATSSAWSEATASTDGPVLTWSTAPPAGNRVGAAGAVTASTWVDIDLGTAVTGDGTYSFVLASNSSNSAIYDSRETLYPPQLVLTPTP